LLQQNNIGITYVGTSNFRMELVRFVPLYFVAMPQSIITITEAPFVLTLVFIVGNIKSKPHTPRGTQFVNLHEDFPREVNKVFVSQPLDQGGNSLDPPRLSGPLGYFGLPMVHIGRLPPSRPDHHPLNYPKYVKDSDSNLMLEYLKLLLEQILKQMMQKFLICLV
jgi:hypothetical protein